MERIDALLEEYLSSGRMPADASEEEAADVRALAHAAGELRAVAAVSNAEATSVAPTARARFERFVIASRNAPQPAAADGEEPETPRRRRSIPLTIGVSLAALAMVGVIAFAAGQVIDRGGVHTAHAMEAGDYAQIEGVVTRTEDRGDQRVLRVATAIGDVTVEASGETSVVDSEDAVPLEAIERGAAVQVGGVVGENRRIRAQTVAISGPVDRVPLRAVPARLRPEQAGLQGRIAVASLAEDASEARIVVVADAGRTYVATITGEAAALLLSQERPLGAHVRVLGGPGGLFELHFIDGETPEGAPDGPDATVPPGRPDTTETTDPALVTIRGVVVEANSQELVVLTARGRVRVNVPAETRAVPGTSGLSQGEITSGALVGHLVVIRGGLAPESGHVVADVIVAGRAVERPAR